MFTVIGSSILADGEDQTLMAARENLKAGATQIKIMGGGGVMSDYDPIHSLQPSPAEIRAAVQAAGDWGTYVLAHAFAEVLGGDDLLDGFFRRTFSSGTLLEHFGPLEHGVRELWTTDRDFARFPGVRTRNPFLESEVHGPRARYRAAAAAGLSSARSMGCISRQSRRLMPPYTTKARRSLSESRSLPPSISRTSKRSCRCREQSCGFPTIT